jgi:hypothetical protein
MVKVCKKHGVKSDMWDPFVEGNTCMLPQEADAVIVMTPHTGMELIWPLSWFRKDCIVADLWKMYPESKLSKTGIYKIGDVK